MAFLTKCFNQSHCLKLLGNQTNCAFWLIYFRKCYGNLRFKTVVKFFYETLWLQINLLENLQRSGLGVKF